MIAIIVKFQKKKTGRMEDVKNITSGVDKKFIVLGIIIIVVLIADNVDAVIPDWEITHFVLNINVKSMVVIIENTFGIANTTVVLLVDVNNLPLIIPRSVKIIYIHNVNMKGLKQVMDHIVMVVQII